MSAASVSRPELPIDVLLPEIAGILQRGCNLVIEAAPGAGKTTRVPPLLLELVAGQVLVLEPRRIAARLAARRAAAERSEAVGETVGYQVRFEKVSGPRTRLHFVTEGVLTQRLLSDPDLRGVGAVVLDEFHERHLDTDLALALLRRLQHRRPLLKLVVMSATLDAAPVAHFLGDCPVLRSEGRTFALTIRHLPYSPLPLDQQVRLALETLQREGQTGHVLVFLPGQAEIRRALKECEALSRRTGALLLPLYGELTPEEQDRAVSASAQQKIILSTNVAESSVTIDGVTAVIDSGLARRASYSPWTGLPTLQVARISRASATQRAGRAGRTAAGVVLRLYPQEDLAQRPEYDTPEILRSELSGVLLTLRAMQIMHFDELAWLDTPPAEAISHAEGLLAQLGVTAENAGELARWPLPPRVGRMLQEAVRRGVAEEGITVAALLGSGTRLAGQDLLRVLDQPLTVPVERQRRQLAALVKTVPASSHSEEALLLSVLRGFPDRVARRRAGAQIQLANGTVAELQGERPESEFLVVLDAEDRKDQQLPTVRLTSRIEPEWLLDLFPERVREDTVLEWNRTGERVESVSFLRHDDLILDESRSGQVDEAEAAALLAAEALRSGLERFVDPEALQNLQSRLAFAGLPAPDLLQSLVRLCQGLRSFAELRSAATSFLPVLEAEAGGILRELAPVSLRLASGRTTRVHYEAGKPPWIASRLQDFFGMTETPRVGRHKEPVVIHLLAPNQRAVQTTTDLPGFWKRLYPEVRRELMRRYPRHAWPENPMTALAERPARTR